MKNQNMSKYNNETKARDANNKDVQVLNEFFLTEQAKQIEMIKTFLYSCIFQLVAMREGRPPFEKTHLSLSEKRLQQEVLFYTIIFLYFHK